MGPAPAKDGQPPKPPRLRLHAELLDGFAVCPGADAFAQLRVEAVLVPSEKNAKNQNANAPSTPSSSASSSSASVGEGLVPVEGVVEVHQISVEWYGVERLDPAWVKPAAKRQGLTALL